MHYRKELSGFVKERLADLVARPESTLLAGIIVAARVQQSRGTRLAVITLDDGSAQIEVTAFAELYDEKRDLLKADRPVVIQGKVARDEYSGALRVRAERIFDLAEARSRFARLVRLSVNEAACGEAAMRAAKLKALLDPYRKGSCPVEIRYDNGSACVEVRLSDDWRVRLEDQLLAELSAWLKPENVEVVYG